jgi:Co/Zn/Cd efflux system component
MGIVGAVLVANWSIGLIRQSSRVLLDWQADKDTVKALQDSIEQETADRVTDLHLWSIGHGIFSAQITVVSDDPKSPSHYKSLIASKLKIVHVNVEVHRRELP